MKRFAKGSFSPFPNKKKHPGKQLLKCAKSSEKLIGFRFGITFKPIFSPIFITASVGLFELKVSINSVLNFTSIETS